MATSQLDSHADEQLRNLSEGHLRNVSSFLSTLLANNKNTSHNRANQNERRLWIYAKCRLFQLQGTRNTSEIARKQRSNIGSNIGKKIVCRKCPNPAFVNLVNIKKFLRRADKSKSILRLSYKCDLCRCIVRRRITLFKHSNVTHGVSKITKSKFHSSKSDCRQSSSLLINSSSSSNKLACDSPSLTNLHKLLSRRRSGVDAKTGLLDFLLECNKK